MRHLVLLILIICKSGYFSQNNCENQKSNLESSKYAYNKYKTLTDLGKNEYLVHQIDKGKEYLTCLKNNGDSTGYDFAWINKEIAKIYFRLSKLNQNNKLDYYKKILDYSFQSKDVFDELLKKKKLNSEEKLEVKKLYVNTAHFIEEYNKANPDNKYPKSEEFTFSNVKLYLNHKDLFDTLKSPKEDFYKYFIKLLEYYNPNGKWINQKSLKVFLKNIYSHKEEYLIDEKYKNLYRVAGYEIRKPHKNKEIDWNFVEELYLKNIKNADKLSKLEKIDSSTLASEYKSTGIMYMFKNKALNINNLEFAKYLNDASEIDSAKYYLNSLKNIAKGFYLIAENKANYYDSAIKYWKLTENTIKTTLGEFHIEYIQIIKYLKTAYLKIGDFDSLEDYDKILLRISANLNNIDFKVTSIASSINGELVVIGCDDGKFKIWNRNEKNTSKDLLKTIVHSEGYPVEKIFILPFNNSFITIGKYNLKLWDSEGKYISKIKRNLEIKAINYKISFDKKQRLIKINNFYYDYNFNLKNDNNLGFRARKTEFEIIYNSNSKLSTLYDKELEKNYDLLDERSVIKPSFSYDDDYGVVKVFSADLNSQINVWNFKIQDEKFIKIDSCNLRRKPKLFFISISKDSRDKSMAEKFSVKLKREILNLSESYFFDDFSSKFFSTEINNAKQFIFFHDSLSGKIYNNDFIIYHYSGISTEDEILFNSDSSKINNIEFFNLSERLSVDNKLFFIDSDKRFSSHLRKSVDEKTSEPGFYKKNLIIISEEKGKYLTESYLNSDSIKIMDLYKVDHKDRTECLHQLYEYFNNHHTKIENKDYRLKSYFQKDGFELNFEDQKFDLGNENSIENRETVLFLVANNDYDNFSNLRNAVNDVNKIEKTFNENLKVKKIKKLINPTYDECINKLDAFLKKYSFKEGSQLLFYFAGHGVYKNLEPKILFKDSPKDFRNNCYMVRELLNKIRIKIGETGLTKALIVIDACNQGQNKNDYNNFKKIDTHPISKYTRDQERKFMNQKTEILITSTSPNEEASDGVNNNSPFCNSFVSSIIENCKNRLFTNHELFRDLKQYDRENKGTKTLRHTNYILNGNDYEDGRFFFFRK